MNGQQQRPAGDVMKRGGIQRKLYRLAYDKPDVHRKVLQLSRSLEEVQKILENVGHGKSNKSRCRCNRNEDEKL